jgi:hypothetical protein
MVAAYPASMAPRVSSCPKPASRGVSLTDPAGLAASASSSTPQKDLRTMPELDFAVLANAGQLSSS